MQHTRMGLQVQWGSLYYFDKTFSTRVRKDSLRILSNDCRDLTHHSSLVYSALHFFTQWKQRSQFWTLSTVRLEGSGRLSEMCLKEVPGLDQTPFTPISPLSLLMPESVFFFLIMKKIQRLKDIRHFKLLFYFFIF